MDHLFGGAGALLRSRCQRGPTGGTGIIAHLRNGYTAPLLAQGLVRFKQVTFDRGDSRLTFLTQPFQVFHDGPLIVQQFVVLVTQSGLEVFQLGLSAL